MWPLLCVLLIDTQRSDDQMGKEGEAKSSGNLSNYRVALLLRNNVDRISLTQLQCSWNSICRQQLYLILLCASKNCYVRGSVTFTQKWVYFTLCSPKKEPSLLRHSRVELNKYQQRICPISVFIQNSRVYEFLSLLIFENIWTNGKYFNILWGCVQN